MMLNHQQGAKPAELILIARNGEPYDWRRGHEPILQRFDRCATAYCPLGLMAGMGQKLPLGQCREQQRYVSREQRQSGDRQHQMDARGLRPERGERNADEHDMGSEIAQLGKATR